MVYGSKGRNARKRLQAALDRRFDDDSRELTVVVGSGLHRHLAEHGVAYPGVDGGARLKNWNALLEAVRRTGGKHKLPLAVRHDDPTATWESLLATLAGKFPRDPVSGHEEVLRERILNLMAGATPAKKDLQRFGKALQKQRFRDIVTVNFDQTLDGALADAAEKPCLQRHVCGPTGQVTSMLRVHLGATRVWHPHGVVADFASASCLQLGVRAYAKSAQAALTGIERFRGRQRTWRAARNLSREARWTNKDAKAWHAEVRRLGRRSACWWDMLINSDVAFIGCGLDRAELDMCLVLHDRQRQLARVSEGARPQVFYLHPACCFPAHLETGPAGIVPVKTESHDEAWELLLGSWWK